MSGFAQNYSFRMSKNDRNYSSPSKLIEVALGSMQYVLSYITYVLNECD